MFPRIGWLLVAPGFLYGGCLGTPPCPADTPVTAEFCRVLGASLVAEQMLVVGTSSGLPALVECGECSLAPSNGGGTGWFVSLSFDSARIVTAMQDVVEPLQFFAGGHVCASASSAEDVESGETASCLSALRATRSGIWIVAEAEPVHVPESCRPTPTDVARLSPTCGPVFPRDDEGFDLGDGFFVRESELATVLEESKALVSTDGFTRHFDVPGCISLVERVTARKAPLVADLCD